MKKIIDPIARFFVGGLLIFSGLIKINDPIGTQIKMEEYFEVFAGDFGSFFHVFVPWALEIGMLMIVLELALGAAILIYYRMTTTTWMLLALMTFFTFLTFYSAYFNKVTDCGCFGDAIKLTPWESFYKDIVLMVFVLHLFWYRKNYVATLRTMEGHTVVLAVVVVSFFLGMYAIRHLPFIDFRAYKVGNHIPQQMIPEEQPVIEYTFEKDGKDVQSQKYLMEAEGYTYKSSKIINAEKTVAKITDYYVSDPDGADVTAQTFTGPRLMIVIVDATKASLKKMDELRFLINALEGKAECYILTSSGSEQIEILRHENHLAIPFYFADATVLKTILRSNPGIALWENGTVLGNWHYNDTPTPEEVLTLLK